MHGTFESAEAFVKAFRDELAARNLKVTRQREAIALALLKFEGHQTLEQLLEHAKSEHPTVGYATVYRTMKLLVECGLATEHKFAEGQVRYEVADDDHHDHMICVACGLITEFEDEEIERLQAAIVKRLGFHVVSHRHELYVRCLDEQGCAERANAR